MVRINRVYTRAGDQGRTQLIGGEKVPKCHLRIDCYGTIDELNAAVGMCISELEAISAPEARAKAQTMCTRLQRVQNELFNVGTQIATPDPERRSKMPDIRDEHVAALESEMDEAGANLPELTSFVLPGGSRASSAFHLARTICRRAERMMVHLSEEEEIASRHLQYLNRLSDYLFVFGRAALQIEGRPETLWVPEDV